jgi:hypothetical protein
VSCTGKPMSPNFVNTAFTKLGVLLLTKFGDMGLAVHDTYTQSWFAVHAVYCTSCVRAVYELRTSPRRGSGGCRFR